MPAFLENPSRRKLEDWLRKNAKRLRGGKFSLHNQLSLYSVDGSPVIVMDMYSKSDDEYMGFEVFTPAGGNSVTEAIEKLEQLKD